MAKPSNGLVVDCDVVTRSKTIFVIKATEYTSRGQKLTSEELRVRSGCMQSISSSSGKISVSVVALINFLVNSGFKVGYRGNSILLLQTLPAFKSNVLS